MQMQIVYMLSSPPLSFPADFAYLDQHSIEPLGRHIDDTSITLRFKIALPPWLGGGEERERDFAIWLLMRQNCFWKHEVYGNCIGKQACR